ncbi:MAG TPA: hypothetical protein VGF76_18470 [Polyangiaceae bacterium]
MRGSVLVQLGAFSLLALRPAAAAPNEPAPFELSYRAPAECPDDATFRADLAKHLRDTSRAAGTRLELAITEHDTGYHGVLVALDSSGHQGTRQIEGKTCAEVAQALAFLARMVIELGGLVDSEVPPAPAPPVPPPKIILPNSHPQPAARKPLSGVQVSVVLLGGARGGFSPDLRPTGELGVDVGASPAVWSPSLRLVGFAGNSELGSLAGSAALRFFGGRLELCPLHLGNTSLTVHACAGGELAAVDARGQIALEPKSVTKLWASAEATLRLQWFATRSFFAELGGGPVFPIVRTHYYFEPDRTLYIVPDVTARVALGFGLLFP